MVSRVIVALCLGVVTAQAGINFTPQQQSTSLEGRPVSQTAFQNGSGKVIYNPPPGWTMQGSGSRLVLSPHPSLSEALVEARPLPPNSDLDGATMEAIKKEMLSSLPKESEKIEWEPVEVNPVLFNQHESRRLTLSYSLFAQRLKLTVLYCNFAEEQIRFRLGCRDNDFGKLYDAFRRSMYTWQGMR